MPVGADPSFGWQNALLAFAIVVLASFLVTWVVTDRAGRRGTQPREDAAESTGLAQQAAQHGIDRFENVELAVMEPTGELSILRRWDSHERDDPPPKAR